MSKWKSYTVRDKEGNPIYKFQAKRFRRGRAVGEGLPKKVHYGFRPPAEGEVLHIAEQHDCVCPPNGV